MKRTILSILLTSLCLSSAMAQEDSLVVYNKFISKTVYTDAEGTASHKWNLDFLSITSEDKNKGGWKSTWGVGPDMIYIGSSQLAGDDVALNPASSWEWGFDLMQIKSWNRRRTFGYHTGIILSRTSYRLEGDKAFHNVEGITVLDNALKEVIGYQRQRLIYWSWRIPFVFNFQPGHNGFSIGAEGELRHHVRSRAKVGDEKKYYISRELDVNPWGCNALVSFNFHKSIYLMGRYSLTDFFKSKSNLDVQPFMVGLTWDL